MGEAARKRKAGIVIENREVIVTCYTGMVTGLSFVVRDATTEELLYTTSYVVNLKSKVERMKWRIKDVIHKSGA